MSPYLAHAVRRCQLPLKIEWYRGVWYVTHDCYTQDTPDLHYFGVEKAQAKLAYLALVRQLLPDQSAEGVER